MIDKAAIPVAICVDVIGASLFALGLSVSIGALSQGVGALAHSHAGSKLTLMALVLGPVLRAMAGWIQGEAGAALGQRQSALWRQRVLPRLLAGRLARPLASGEIVSLGTDHIAAIRAHGQTFVPARQGAVLGPVIVLAVIAVASPVSALILGATLLAFIVGMVIAGTAARHASDRQLQAIRDLSALFVDRLTHLGLIRHFGTQDRLGRQMRAATGEVAQRTLAVLRIAFLSSAVLEFAGALSVALVAVYCGFSLLGLLPFRAPEHLTLASAFFALAMAPEFYLPMRRLAAAYHEKQIGEAAMRALDEIGDGPLPGPTDNDGTDWLGLIAREVVIAWPGSRIGPVSFEMGAHGLIALVGPTGSGKSSVLSAIAGLIEPSCGQISDARGYPLARELIASCAQQPLLLPGTLAENIALACPEASRDEILAVTERVGLCAMMARRPEGLELVVDERGSGLSGGERKRIGLARALLSGRPLLLLDEPTADLDARSAAAVTDLIANLAKAQPIIVATHDPALMARANSEVEL